VIALQRAQKPLSLREICHPDGLLVDGDWVESKDQDINGDVRLIQLADVGVGRFLDKSSKFLTREAAKRLRCTYLEQGDILIARMPDPIGRACEFPGDKGACITVVDVCILRPSPGQFSNRWLVWQLNSQKVFSVIRRLVRGTTRQRISRTELERLELLVPSLPEQRRIADILDRAEALRAKRRAALAQLDELTRATFLDMFGEHHLSKWQIVSIAEIAASDSGAIRTGPFGSQLLHSEFVESGISVLGIDNVVSNEFTWTANRFITEEKYRHLRRYTVKPGDVLITIMGTCGRCAIVPKDAPTAINTKHICCITTNADLCCPEFLRAYFLIHPTAQKYLRTCTKGAIMDGLNMGVIKNTPIPLAPLPLQQEFARRVQAIDRLKSLHRDSLAQLDALFQSLQHRAFRGEL
jgi:type I restriction enzyme S subunit